MTPSDVIAAARGLLGTTYQHQGRNPGLAVDCIGLLGCVARQLGIPYQEFSAYGPEPFDGMLVRELDKRMPRALVEAPGCAVIMCWFKNGEPQHCGIITDKNTLIHAYAKVKTVCEHRIDDQWRKRFVHAYAFPGVIYPAGVVAS